MPQKKLRFTKAVNGLGVEGRCEKCQRPFGPFADAAQNPSAANKLLVNEFNKHDCDEDASQAAARIVREATQDK
jgi:hypothetical protein